MTNDHSMRRHHKTSVLSGALLVSVVLNLFFVGVLAGILPGGHNGKHFAPMALASPHGEYMGDWLTRYLAPADAAAFRDVMQPNAEALHQAHEHVRQAIRDVAAVYEQDPPDPAALQAALDRVKQAKAAVDDAVGKVIEDSYTKLSPEARRRLADMTR